MPLPRPTRYGHVLRRLLAKKTSAINVRIAQRLLLDGLITVDNGVVLPEGASTVNAALTPKGIRAAELATKGVRLYGHHGRPQHPAVKDDV